MALTNHALVRIAGAMAGKRNFSDYLVLGDDVVIARKEVAMHYQELMIGLGVDISTTKSIFPSEVGGMEFASKLLTKEGNLSPLPLRLLSRESSLPMKLEFIVQVVDRMINSVGSHASDFESILNAVFRFYPKGIRQDTCKAIFGEYYLLQNYLKLSSTDLRSGTVPRALSSTLSKLEKEPDHPLAVLVTLHES